MVKRARAHAEHTAKQFNAARVINGPLGFWRWLEILGFVIAVAAAIIGAWSAWLAQNGLAEDRKRWVDVEYPAIQEERELSAIRMLSDDQYGAIGKNKSIEFLLSQGITNFSVTGRCQNNPLEGYNERYRSSCQDLLRIWVDFDLNGPAPRAGFEYANWEGLHFYENDLSSIDGFRSTTIDDVIFEFTKFWLVSFENSQLTRVGFYGTKCPWGMLFRNTKLKNVVFSRGEIASFDFSGAYLESVQFQEQDLSEANFTDAIFDGIYFCDVLKLGLGECSIGLTREQIESAYSDPAKWNPDVLPPYLKIGPKESWPKPKPCRPYGEDSPKCLTKEDQILKITR
ncbi:MAG: pentapeptide repeat-containing protein [Pseudomonadota bacterium]